MRKQTRQVLAVLENQRRRRETAGEHIRNAVQLLSNLHEFGALDPNDRRQVRATIDRLWRGLREIEKGNV
jgi:hypothetical protein